MAWNRNSPADSGGLVSQPIRENFAILEKLLYGGQSVINSTVGRQVLFSDYGFKDLADTLYGVDVSLMSWSPDVGAIYVSNRTTVGFWVYNTGTETAIPFTWVLTHRDF